MTVVLQSYADRDYALRAARVSDAILVASGKGATGDFIRRPMRGIVIPNDTHASLTVVGPNSANGRRLANSSTPPGMTTTVTHNFILQNLTESRSEKSQFITTFGATYGFFFGEQPRIVSCTAVLLNTADFEWSKEWWQNYSSVLRGTSLASSNTMVELKYGEGRDVTCIRGYLTNCTTMLSGQDPRLMQVSFSMFVESLTRGSVSHRAPRREATGARDYLGVGGLSSPDEQLRLDESTTAAVRRLNVKLSPFKTEPGVLGKIASALNSVDAALDSTIRQARNFLYGRNLVIPVSYVGAEPPRSALFPEGSGSESLEGLTLTNFFGSPILAFSDRPGKTKTVILRTNTDGDRFGLSQKSLQRDSTRYYYQNTDEYVNYASPIPSILASELETAAALGDLRLQADRALYAPQAVAAFAAFGIDVVPFPGPIDRADRATLEAQSNAYYWAEYSKAKTAEALRIVGRTALGIATFAIGQSVVNHRRRLQASITNPNSGNLTAQQDARLRAQIAAEQRSTEQQRLVAERKAASLRGETGVIYPGTLGAVLSVIL